MVVIQIHVVHVVVAGVVTDDELRIEHEQLLQGVLHGEDATDDDGALRIDVGLALSNTCGKRSYMLGDALVLLRSELGQFAVAPHFLAYHPDFLQNLMALRGQLCPDCRHVA